MTPPRKKDSTSTKSAKPLSNKAATAKLTKLGDKPTAQPDKSLEVFPNPQPKRDFLIHMQIPEFTCLCAERPASRISPRCTSITFRINAAWS